MVMEQQNSYQKQFQFTVQNNLYENNLNKLEKHYQTLALFMINLVDTKVDAIKDIFNKIAQKNIPFIFEGIPTQDIINFIKQYNRDIFIGSDTKQFGVLQGKIVVNSWNANKKAIIYMIIV